MTTLPNTIGDLLERLAETSERELDAVQQLTLAIRRADDRMIEEVRGLTLMHEARREAIFDELQHLAARLCALPVRAVTAPPIPVLRSPLHAPQMPSPVSLGPDPVPRAAIGGDWREATQRIDDEIDQFFGRSGPKH